MVSRIAAELGLSGSDTDRLLAAAAHDRVTRAIRRNYPARSWALLVRCLDAARLLSQEHSTELLELVDQLVTPLEKLEAARCDPVSLAAQPRSDEETTMT